MRSLIIIPTYNEKENIKIIVPQILSKTDCDLLIVDDSSPDKTYLIVQQMAKKNRRIHLLLRKKKEGLRKAYIEGFRWGLERKYKILIQMDADFSHQPDDIEKLIHTIKNGADVAIGSRYSNGVRVLGWDLMRLLISVGGNIYAYLLTQVPIADLTGGFNAWKSNVIKSINLEKIKAEGYAFQIELKFWAYYLGFKLDEVPIIFKEREIGQTKMNKKIIKEAIWRCLVLGSKVLWWKTLGQFPYERLPVLQKNSS